MRYALLKILNDLITHLYTVLTGAKSGLAKKMETSEESKGKKREIDEKVETTKYQGIPSVNIMLLVIV